MRGPLIILLMATAMSAPAQTPDQREKPSGEQEQTTEEIVWSEAFSSVASDPSAASLILLVITDDDAYTTEPGEIWCEGPIRRAVAEAAEERPQLQRRIKLQTARAGLPSVLTGGSQPLPPQRAMVAICDRQFRLLAFAIGVPTASELQTLIEDAEQVQVTLGPNSDQADATEELVTERSRSRLTRVWQQQLDNVDASVIDAVDPLEDSAATLTDGDVIRRMSIAADDYQDLYLADAVQRFGLAGKNDHLRLIRLEQHLETRRSWCEAMAPLVIGHDFQPIWRPLTETVWSLPVVVRSELDSMLGAWWSSVTKHQAVCLAVLPAVRANQPRWPPLELAAESNKRRASWQDLQAAIAKLPSRTITAQQLAALIHAKELSAIQYRQPTPARYLLFSPHTDRTLIIREGDVPSLWISLVKRLAS